MGETLHLFEELLYLFELIEKITLSDGIVKENQH